MSAIAHCIAGVLDQEAMAEIIESFAHVAEFKPGARVKTFRGSARGVVVRIAADGRVVWKADGSDSELMASAASLLPETPIP
ncbi:hypothetical protein LBMAG56_45680 [Verrucomicrobiota bacterium]|nr:hypothetical protein LBMAG56_45680 [Verrucomicrobiota bacterium]